MTLTIGEPLGVREAISGMVTRIARAAAERPDAMAVVSQDGGLTYGELWLRALGVAAQLAKNGVRRGDPVALCAPRSASFVVGAVGILAAGGCYVPLDPAYPTDRLAFMLADSEAQVVVTTSDVAARIGAARWIDPMAHQAPSRATPIAAEARDAVYVVYTSGSTGRPKGVIVEHAALSNLVDWHLRAFGVTESDRGTLISSPGFDASAWEMWPYLAVGASLHVPPEAVKTDPIALRDWLLAQRITTTFVPTPLCEALIALDWPAVAPLRTILTGGDVLHRRPRPGMPFRLINNYGVAEGAVVSASGVVEPADPASQTSELPTLGAAIPGVHLTVVGSDGRPLPAGTPGELVIAGPSVARGYVGDHELTRAKFYIDAAGMRCYRTGDLVRMRTSGELDYHGRLDEQVQIRGVRVELNEIVAALDDHPRVSASAVVPVGRNGNRRLSAYVVGTPGHAPGAAELRQYLEQQLPVHMIPADCTILAELPTTANGKIDRQMLCERGPALAGRDDLTPPRTDLERSLAAIAADVLWLPAVGIDEDFFALGGHSLLGAQLSIRIGEQFGIEVPLRSVFENPTVAEMAVEVERLIMVDIDEMSAEELLRAATGFDPRAGGGPLAG
ncbi:MAG TPA: non-ribosomal peptide synthetase [Mycobacterium sp.]|nr:non-ribosomal peptide synthetase [Mycobacterium sp.]